MTPTEAADIRVVRNKHISEYFRNIGNWLFCIKRHGNKVQQTRFV